jgi:adenosine deaminase
MSQTELHRHLDVSTRASTLLELCQNLGHLPRGDKLEDFKQWLYIDRPLNSLSEVLAHFKLFQKVLMKPETLERVAFEAAEDCAREGTTQVEFRYSPKFVSEYSKLPWDEVLAAWKRGLTKAQAAYPSLKSGLLCIASRDYGVEAVSETVEFYLKHQADFVGFDMAGNEVGFPCRDFESALKPLRLAGAPITIHAGEAVGPDAIWEAIELLGARRIGHGISAIQDPKLMQVLAERSICLEMCPTSNWVTRAVPSLAAHPLPQVLRAGVPVCINTDDPGVFPVTLPSEKELCRTQMGLTSEELQLCEAHARKASFIA